MSDRDDHDDLATLFVGLDAPRAVPPELDEALRRSFDDLEALAGVEAAAAPRPLPADLRDRLLAAGAVGLPSRTRRLLLHRLGAGHDARWIRAAAVVIAVLMVAGGVAVAGGTGSRPERLDVAAPTTTTTTAIPEAVAPPVTAVTPEVTPETTTTTSPPPPAPPQPSPPRETLLAAASCDDLLVAYRSHGAALVGPYGLPRTTTTASAAGATSADGSTSHAPSHSGTNVQEAGVDEPDLVKTDGRRIFAIDMAGGGHVLRVLTYEDGAVTLRSTTALPGGATSMLLHGERLLVIEQRSGPHRADEAGGSGRGEPMTVSPGGSWRWSWTAVQTYDVADVDTPRLVHVRSVEGSFVDARAASGVVRLVLRTEGKGPAYDRPRDGSEAEKQRATEENRERTRRSTLDDWMPAMVAEDLTQSSPAVTRTRLCDCDDALRPAEFSGFGHVSVLTIDPDRPEAIEAASIQGAADDVYASPSSLYTTTSPWRSGRPTRTDGAESVVHRFAIEGRTPARYEASGIVPGRVLNQFSMSEHGGHVRIATTMAKEGTTESRVSVLRQVGGRLVIVGHVDGLGRGERIYAVRFIGDTGYVVTFRQVDPMYVIDLRDPTAPRVTGELKITGYSAYLHPVDPDRLLGVGQEASEEGFRAGAQVSLFDVADPAAPARSDQVALSRGSHSAAEFDHRAFLWWAPTRSAVIPVIEFDTERSADGRDETTSYALVLRAGRDDLEVQGRVTHAERTEAWSEGIIMRTFVIGGALFTLSNAGLLVSDLETLGEQQWVAL